MVPREKVFMGARQGWIFVFLFGRYWGGQKWQILKSILIKTRVGFGRTELSLMLSCTEFCALSSGHGPRNPWFEGGGETLDFHDFWGGEKYKKTMNMQYEHGLQSSRPAQNDLLNNPEHFQGFSAHKTQKIGNYCKKFGFLGVSDSQSIAEIA